MSGLLGKIPKFTLKLPASLAKTGRSMSECPLELSFSLCEEGTCRKAKTGDILQVNLPVETKGGKQKMEKQEAFEKADEEKSEKDDNMEVTCSVSVDGQEKQEFSFTLYDFDTKERVNKQDMEKIVVRSICEALGKTLKLPPSGSRTIKVKLAISPDSSKDLGTNDLEKEVTKWPAQHAETQLPCKHQDYDSSKSANTASTYLMSSATDKPPSNYAHCNVSTVNFVSQDDAKPMPSPKLKPVRHSRLVSVQRQELKSGMKEHHKRPVDESILDNRFPQSEIQKAAEEHKCQSLQHSNSRAHVPESRERRNHYLDLAGIENDANHTNDFSQKLCTSTLVDPNYVCPYRILDRTHVCSKPHRIKDVQESSRKKQTAALFHPKDNTGNIDISHMYRTQLNTSTHDDLLNLNLDLCDLVPEAKFDWEKMHHRRSKSYDLHESALHSSAGLYSPKLKPRRGQNAPALSENVKNQCHMNSPAHHIRFRHRDKERQRAMQQVANWIAREHVREKNSSETQFLCSRCIKPSQNNDLEKHEHHHLHEHIHHHYHHFVDF